MVNTAPVTVQEALYINFDVHRIGGKQILGILLPRAHTAHTKIYRYTHDREGGDDELGATAPGASFCALWSPKLAGSPHATDGSNRTERAGRRGESSIAAMVREKFRHRYQPSGRLLGRMGVFPCQTDARNKRLRQGETGSGANWTHGREQGRAPTGELTVLTVLHSSREGARLPYRRYSSGNDGRGH